MAEPLNSSNNTNQASSSDPFSFGANLWPKQVIATPLKGVSIEVSSYPPSVAVMFDVLALLQGGGVAAKAGKAAAPAARLAESAGRAAGKVVSKAVADALKPGQDVSFLESLKTFLAVNPSLSFLAPVVGFAELLEKFSPLQ
ncbi:MAG TPA: hypothetical protein VFW62_07205 [bacterium]|nr:hypothetical protein [bacterium]